MKNVSIVPSNDSWADLHLDGDLGIADAATMANLLRQTLPGHPRLRIHCRKLASVDTAILQLLVAARQSFAALVLAEPSPAYERALRDAGLEPLSAIPHENE